MTRHYSKVMEIHPGLQRREWLHTLAKTMFSSFAKACGTQEEQPWGAGLPSLENYNSGLNLTPAHLFIAWLERALEVLRTHREVLNSQDSAQISVSVPENTTTSIQTHQSSVFYAGEDPLRFLKHCMANALSDSTIGYGFGLYEVVQKQESTYTDGQRKQLDSIAQQFYALAPEVFCSLRPRWFEGKPSLRVVTDEIYSWFISAQSHIPLWFGYNPVDAEIFSMSTAQRRTSLECYQKLYPGNKCSLEDMDHRFFPDIRLCCTYDVYGDDAGDFSDPREEFFTPLYQCKPAADLKIYTIDSFEDYKNLLQRYPQPVPRWDSDYSYWSPGLSVNLVLNWEAIAHDYDGVGLTIRGALDAAFVPCATDAGVGLLSGFTPGSVAYVRSPFGSSPEENNSQQLTTTQLLL